MLYLLCFTFIQLSMDSAGTRWVNTGHGSGSSDTTFGYGNNTGYGYGRSGTHVATATSLRQLGTKRATRASPVL